MLLCSSFQQHLHRHDLHGRVIRRKSIKILHQKFTKAHLDGPGAFLEQVLWTDEAQTELFGLEKQRCVGRTKDTKLGIRNTCPTVKNGEDSSCRGES